MSNKVCRPVVNVPEYLVAAVKVPTGMTLSAGDVILANSYDTGISGNFQVYTASTPITATLGQQMAVVINGGWEQLTDGRRPEGQPDYTQYSYSAGEIATIVFLAPQVRFEISYDALSATPTVGQYAYPVNNSKTLSVGNSIPSGTFSAFKVLALKNFRLGGQFGSSFASTAVVSVQNPTA
jgi:hypothetical protein